MVLVRPLPPVFGDNITPFMIASDAQAMTLMSHACCQTYLQKVWKGRMGAETPIWKVGASLVFLSLFWLFFKNNSLSIDSFVENALLEFQMRLMLHGTRQSKRKKTFCKYQHWTYIPTLNTYTNTKHIYQHWTYIPALNIYIVLIEYSTDILEHDKPAKDVQCKDVQGKTYRVRRTR